MISLKLSYLGVFRRISITEAQAGAELYSRLILIAARLFEIQPSFIRFGWTDEDGDFVVLDSHVELEEALRVMRSIQPSNKLCFNFEVLAKPTSIPSEQKAKTKPVHDKVCCDECNMCPIVGTRYKCSVRQNYDLCENCESAKSQPYAMIKIYKPEQSPAAIFIAVNDDNNVNMNQSNESQNYFNQKCERESDILKFVNEAVAFSNYQSSKMNHAPTQPPVTAKHTPEETVTFLATATVSAVTDTAKKNVALSSQTLPPCAEINVRTHATPENNPPCESSEEDLLINARQDAGAGAGAEGINEGKPNEHISSSDDVSVCVQSESVEGTPQSMNRSQDTDDVSVNGSDGVVSARSTVLLQDDICSSVSQKGATNEHDDESLATDWEFVNAADFCKPDGVVNDEGRMASASELASESPSNQPSNMHTRMANAYHSLTTMGSTHSTLLGHAYVNPPPSRSTFGCSYTLANSDVLQEEIRSVTAGSEQSLSEVHSEARMSTGSSVIDGSSLSSLSSDVTDVQIPSCGEAERSSLLQDVVVAIDNSSTPESKCEGNAVPSDTELWFEELRILADMGFDDVNILIPLLRIHCKDKAQSLSDNSAPLHPCHLDLNAIQNIVNEMLELID